MKPEREKHVQGTSRQYEEKHLKETLAVIHDNMESFGRQVREMKADIDEMLEHYHDNDVEVYTILTNTITMHDHMKRALERNEKASNKPYFGRICFHDEGLDREESIYIGKGGISRDTTHQVVTDWRAPVANAYYENGLGKCSYRSPDGTMLQIDLKLKRTYEIEQGKLLDYFDSEVISNDDLLTKYLARNKQAVLGEIVATIQKEQNEIIRKSPYHNIIVQGVAGSGKTTVAMHRISYILYNYPDRFRPDDFYIVGSNRILLNYITGVLPDLDVHGVRQMTMEQLFVRLLYEDWDPKKYRISKSAQNGKISRSENISQNGKLIHSGKPAHPKKEEEIRGSHEWFCALKAFCDRLEQECISTESVFLDPLQFVEGIHEGRTGVFDKREGREAEPRELIKLVDGESVRRYISQNPGISIQSKINMLNERLLTKVKDEFLGKGIKYTDAEKKAILKAYRGRYGSSVWKQSTYRLYRRFLEEQNSQEARLPGEEKNPGEKKLLREESDIPVNEFDVYDLAALAYIYKRTKETEVISEAHHMVIDEAQDFGMMVYDCLHFCVTGCTYTIMGDVSQNIRFGVGLNDWEDLKRLLLPDEADSFGVLKKSYRNTVEISHFATDILHHGNFVDYPVEPIIRHGKPVRVIRSEKGESLWKQAASICRSWQEADLPTIAVICRDKESAVHAARQLGQYIELKDSLSLLEEDMENAEFGNGIMVLPVEYTKGLEFDAVLILNPTRKEYPSDDGHARLLYVAATRALHELCVLHGEDLTGLIADPVPDTVRKPAPESRSISAEIPSSVPETQKPGSGKKTMAETDTPAGRPAISRPRAAVPDSRATPADSQTVPARTRVTPPGSQTIPSKARVTPFASGAAPSGSKATPSVSHATPPGSQTIPSKAHVTPSGSGTAPAAPKSAASPSLPYAFGDLPATEKLRVPGHPKIDLALRWVSKMPDGLYLQSRYGILRLSPTGSGIVRVTFARGSKLRDGVHPMIRVNRIERFWTYKDAGASVTLSTEEITVQADKNTGALLFLNSNKKPLLRERSRECRQIEPFPGGGQQCWLFLEPSKKEQMFAVGPKDEKMLPLRGTARYISGEKQLPFLFSDQGYGILIASGNPVFSCDLPSYGTYLHTEGEEQLDFYFIAGRNPDTLTNACRFLYGEL